MQEIILKIRYFDKGLSIALIQLPWMVMYSGFWVIPKIISTNLCKPIHDITNYSTSICSFESGKCGKQEEKLQKFEYL